jgi:hypothetical protein
MDSQATQAQSGPLFAVTHSRLPDDVDAMDVSEQRSQGLCPDPGPQLSSAVTSTCSRQLKPRYSKSPGQSLLQVSMHFRTISTSWALMKFSERGSETEMTVSGVTATIFQLSLFVSPFFRHFKPRNDEKSGPYLAVVLCRLLNDVYEAVVKEILGKAV